jgi:hypothetical protein
LPTVNARGENDEFVLSTIVGETRPIDDGDGTTLYYNGGFEEFACKAYRNPYFATMTK